MILPLFRRAQRLDTISTLYGAIVAQARSPCFYRDYGVPDTVEGRFELIVLHLTLVFARLAREGEVVRILGQSVFDHFCRDMDQNLREMGVGDLKVPAEMQKIGQAYYGRAKAYEAALSSADPEALTEALTRNVYAGKADAAAALRLAAYIREAVGDLARQDGAALAGGELQFSDPAALVEG